ncbi:hypothetical protein [Paraconexibacter algicola]|uniref:Uncharacterized protein n=2 Tax=Solirubrobacterales TaxID=588673 RepID=A0A2T4ULT1_9ACTN|nr:hypothetical protein [Paraconexibacter algicola]PTL60190.1 hypothetical protein C7Y72_11345 [Paraconexibacter algicola]
MATATPVQAPEQGGRMDLVRAVVEQIVGRTLGAAEIDAIAASAQPIALAFDRARQGRAEQARVQAAREAVSWGATLDLRETASGEGVFAVSGSFVADGREIAVEVRLLGDGTAGVMPLRLDVDVDAQGRTTRLGFAGRATASDGAAGTGAAASAAAWAGLPVRVHGPDGRMDVTTLADARGARPGGGHLVDLVA